MSKDWRFRYQHEKKKEARKEFEGWNEDNFIDHILELRSAVAEMDQVMEELRKSEKRAAKNEIAEVNYKQDWSYPTKIAFFLHQHQKPLTSEDLHKLLLKLDHIYKGYISPRNNLTVSLNRAVKSGRVKKIKVPGIRTLYYVLPEWVDKEGGVKAEFNSVFNQFQ